MSERGQGRRPYGVVGVFLLLLGAGVILDADGNRVGSALIVAGIVCLVAEWRSARTHGEERAG